MRVLRAVAAIAVVSGTIIAVPATAHADETRARQWYLTTMRLAEAQEQATGKGVTIGLVDAGIDPAHPDIEGAVAETEVFGEGGGPNGGQGGNGTANAAILAGHGHGGDAGVLGVAPEAEIVAADVAGASPDQTASIVEAVEYLTRQNVDVIAIGLTTVGDEKLRVATQQAAKKGIPVVAAAGTNGSGDAAGYPVGSKGTVNVLGTDKDGAPVPSDVPTPGADEAVTVAAPAEDLPMAGPGTDYNTGTQPSFATAIVAGTMALVKERQPDLKGEDLISVIKDSASGKGEFDEELGYGIVDPVQALKTGASTSEGAATGSVLGGRNTTLALIIAVVGVLGLGALVVVVRSRDARARRLVLAAPGRADTGTMPRISDTGTMPRISTGPPVGSADTGTFPRVTDTPPRGTANPHTPPHGTANTHTPPYGQNRPGR